MQTIKYSESDIKTAPARSWFKSKGWIRYRHLYAESAEWNRVTAMAAKCAEMSVGDVNKTMSSVMKCFEQPMAEISWENSIKRPASSLYCYKLSDNPIADDRYDMDWDGKVSITRAYVPWWGWPIELIHRAIYGTIPTPQLCSVT